MATTVTVKAPFVISVGKVKKTKKKRSKRAKRLDAARKALAPGKRISRTGKIYYEYRANRSDPDGLTAKAIIRVRKSKKKRKKKKKKK